MGIDEKNIPESGLTRSTHTSRIVSDVVMISIPNIVGERGHCPSLEVCDSLIPTFTV